MVRAVVTSFVLAVSVVAIVARVAPARAQSPSATELGAARELFESGLRAAREERWSEARDAFERSLAIAPLATTRLNLAGAQVQTGQLVAGAESYRTFLAEATRGRAARYRAEAERALAEAEARIPHVHVELRGLRPGDVVQLDGRTVAAATLSVPLRVDPGEHVIAVRRAGRTTVESRFTLDERERRDVVLDAARAERPPQRLGAVPSRRALTSPRASSEHGSAGSDDDRGGSVLASPWLWIGVGIVAIGGATVAIVLGTNGGEPELYRGTLGPGMVTFE